MEQYKSMLVVIDPTKEEQKALNRALHLAAKTGAAVKLFLSIYDFSYEMTTMLSAEEREAMRKGVVADRLEWLESILENSKMPEVSTELKVVWHNRPFEAVVKEVIESDHDLIVKGTHQHDKFKSVIFTPTDWHLLRKSPVPVLLVKDHDWPESGNILAAVNAGNDDESHLSLNNRIAEEAKHLAELINAKPYLVNAYPGTPVNIAIEIPEFDPTAYTQAVKEHHEEELKKLAEKYAISEQLVHEGLPEDVIPKQAKLIDAELVILGTVGRQGLSAALIGNTAEHVIDCLDCDVLALKPEGFVSPLQK